MKSWATFMYRFRWAVIGLWLVAFVVLQIISSVVGNGYSDKFTSPDTDSTRAFSILQESFPTNANSSIQVVFKTDDGKLTDAENKAQIKKTVETLSAMPHVTAVINPVSTKVDGQISPDGRIGYATVVFDKDDDNINSEIDAVGDVVDKALTFDTKAMQVNVGGQLAQQTQQQQGSPSELIGVIAAAIILAITFGTLVATAVPLVTAIIALAIGLALDAFISHFITVAQFTPQLASLIGLGVGIDYALFLVSRYRTELRRGKTVEESVIIAVNTSGRAVTFAGITVCIALLGMIVLGVNFLVGVAIACSVAVAVTMFASLTLLPALLGVLGHKVNRLRLRPARPHGQGPTRWERWAALIQRRPIVAVAAGFVIIALLAAPFLSLRLAFSDAGTGSSTQTTKRAYDILGEGFGAGSNGPFLIASNLDSPSDAAALPKLESALRATDGVAFVSPAVVDKAKNAALITLLPKEGPQADSTTKLLDTLREDVVPGATDGTGLTTYIGGATASSADFSEILSSKLPQFVGIVVLLSTLLLVLVFRSIAIPIKAAVMNLLSIAAAFGVVVAVFQWGWFNDLLGVSGTGPIEPFIPVILFAVLFGLSMDYEVFLVSRIHEEWVHTKDNTKAVARGLGTTAGVITAAATIMIAVFGAFIFLPDRVIKIFGVGLASAIFIDAFIIRTLLVPGIMFLIGKWNWWLPNWMDRIVPRLSIEGDYEEDEPQGEPELAGSRS